MPLKRALLIRHGQTDWNQAGRWQGSEPVPLNDEGRRQATALATALRGSSIAAIISSDLPRAWETAVVIGLAVGLSPRPDPRWREFQLGIFQGHTREEIQSKFPEHWQRFSEDFWDFEVPGGESRRALQLRVFDAWQDVQNSEAEVVAIVSHGGSIRMLLRKLFAGDPTIEDLHLANTSVTTLEDTALGWQIREAASVAHLHGFDAADDTSF